MLADPTKQHYDSVFNEGLRPIVASTGLEVSIRSDPWKTDWCISKIIQVPSGYIYVLRSLSQQKGIVDETNHDKIGYSSGPVEERIKNAKDDPTYLMEEVQIVTTFDYTFDTETNLLRKK